LHKFVDKGKRDKGKLIMAESGERGVEGGRDRQRQRHRPSLFARICNIRRLLEMRERHKPSCWPPTVANKSMDTEQKCLGYRDVCCIALLIGLRILNRRPVTFHSPGSGR